MNSLTHSRRAVKPAPVPESLPFELWRKAWRVGVAPQLSVSGLLALASALERDDPALTQGTTCKPPCIQVNALALVEAACAVCYPAWKASGLVTVGALDDFFAAICWECDRATGEPGSSRHFLDWFDRTDRGHARRELLAEVRRELRRRAG